MVHEQGENAGAVVLFDGACGLCHRGVRFVVRHERQPRVRFASLQSEWARAALLERGLNADAMDTMIVLDGDRVLVRSDAVLFVAGELRRPWRWVQVLKVLPRWVRDPGYRVVARWRQRVFGKRDVCELMTGELAGRLVDGGGEQAGGPKESSC